MHSLHASSNHVSAIQKTIFLSVNKSKSKSKQTLSCYSESACSCFLLLILLISLILQIANCSYCTCLILYLYCFLLPDFYVQRITSLSSVRLSAYCSSTSKPIPG